LHAQFGRNLKPQRKNMNKSADLAPFCDGGHNGSAMLAPARRISSRQLQAHVVTARETTAMRNAPNPSGAVAHGGSACRAWLTGG
jgi:hypothetical protein